jgi:hypothetical protein
MARLAIVTATTDRARAAECIASWTEHAHGEVTVHVVDNGPMRRHDDTHDGDAEGEYLGTVPAFRRGVDEVLALYPEVEVIACLHDDLEIFQWGWDEKVLRHFDRQPACGLAGFGGAIGLGSDDLYSAPYDPMHLARIGFRSNLRDAEVHGARSLLTERVACLDGFSQIGRRAFWEGQALNPNLTNARQRPRPWTVLEDLGVIHHAYDAMLGALAARYGWEVWYLPVACTHYGGRTAVGDAGYGDWARTKNPNGDQGFWEQAHQICYDNFGDVLPLRV